MNLDDLARVHDDDLNSEPAGQVSGPGAQTLLSSIMSQPPAQGARAHGRRWRGPAPWVAAAASLAATVLVVTMVTTPEVQRPNSAAATPSPGTQPSARRMLFAAASAASAAKQPVQGAYWLTTTVSGTDAISPDRGYVIRLRHVQVEGLSGTSG